MSATKTRHVQYFISIYVAWGYSVDLLSLLQIVNFYDVLFGFL